MFVYTNCITVS